MRVRPSDMSPLVVIVGHESGIHALSICNPLPANQILATCYTRLNSSCRQCSNGLANGHTIECWPYNNVECCAVSFLCL